MCYCGKSDLRAAFLFPFAVNLSLYCGVIKPDRYLINANNANTRAADSIAVE